MELAVIDVFILVDGDVEVDFDSGDYWNTVRFFLERFIINSQSSDSIQINSNWGNLNFS